MKRILVNVPTDKLDQFWATMISMGFNPIEEELKIPEAHQQYVLDSIKNSTRADYSSAEEFLDELDRELDQL